MPGLAKKEWIQVNIMNRDKIKGGLIGLCVGDALGVPVEGYSRKALKKNPVTGMSGYGSHNQPAGTWSDDSSLAFCLAESLAAGFDLEDIADKFVKWLYEGYWNPYGNTFGIGRTTYISISKLKQGASPLDSGGEDEGSNGNGSLMRILPLAFYLKDEAMDKKIELIHKVSAITHAHPRSLVACAIYVQFAIEVIRGNELADSYNRAIEKIRGYYTGEPYLGELKVFKRIMDGNIGNLKQEEINSSGYVLDTLEASLWCLLNYNSYEDSVLAAVNLGHDTDTTAAVTGGIAGIYYGMEAIPDVWIKALPRKEDIVKLAGRLYESIS